MIIKKKRDRWGEAERERKRVMEKVEGEKRRKGRLGRGREEESL